MSPTIYRTIQGLGAIDRNRWNSQVHHRARTTTPERAPAIPFHVSASPNPNLVEAVAVDGYIGSREPKSRVRPRGLAAVGVPLLPLLVEHDTDQLASESVLANVETYKCIRVRAGEDVDRPIIVRHGGISVHAHPGGGARGAEEIAYRGAGCRSAAVGRPAIEGQATGKPVGGDVGSGLVGDVLPGPVVTEGRSSGQVRSQLYDVLLVNVGLGRYGRRLSRRVLLAAGRLVAHVFDEVPEGRIAFAKVADEVEVGFAGWA